MLFNYPNSFKKAVDGLIEDEGGYVNDKNDGGGETKYGISKRSYPDINIKQLTRDEAISIYYEDWWKLDIIQVISFDRLQEKVFNIIVNIGEKNTIKCLQRSILCSLDYKIELVEDGILGKNTVKYINIALTNNKLGLYYSFKSEVAAYYRVIGNKRFLRGWLKRAYS